MKRGPQTAHTLDGQVVRIHRGQHQVHLLTLLLAPVQLPLFFAQRHGGIHRQSQLFLHELGVLHSGLHPLANHCSGYGEQQPQDEAHRHHECLLGTYRFERGNRRVDDPHIADRSRLDHLQLLRIVQQGGVELRGHLGITRQPYDLLLGGRQFLGSFLYRSQFRTETLNLGIQRLDTGVLFGELLDQSLTGTLQLRQLSFDGHCSLQQRLGFQW